MNYLLSFVFGFLLLPEVSFCQFVLYRDIVKGGITGGGGNTHAGSGTVYFDAFIPAGSTVKKAYLISMAHGKPKDIVIDLNGINYTINPTGIVTQGFLSIYTNFIPPVTSSVNVLDVTQDINPAITQYALTVPPPNNLANPSLNRFASYYLFIVYENPALAETAIEVVLNDKDVSANIIYSLNNLNPVNAANDVGFAFVGDSFCNTFDDGSYVYVNNNNLGLTGGEDYNTNYTCSGVQGHFYYYNNTLYGLGDDTANTTMNGPDALANIQSYISNNTTSLNIDFVYQTPSWWEGARSNPIVALFLAYTTPCQSFQATVDYTCQGSTYQLTATGGINYEWEPQTDLSCYNCPNPVYTGSKTTHYTCRIWSTDSCSKVLPLRINVPRPDSVAVIAGICGNDNGKINFIKTTSGNSPYTYSIAGQSNSSGDFSGISGGAYTYTVTDAMGCVFSDTVSITESNIVKAGFLTKKFKEDLLKIDFINNSSNATHYMWVLSNGDTLYSENFTQIFDSGGTYQVMLIAYNNYPHCADTVMHTIQVEHALVVLAPNVFTPNGDGLNDSFSINVKGAKDYSVSIFNRWGTEVFNYQKGNDMSWDGHTANGKEATDGAYYWVVSGILENGESFQKQGAMHLMR
ncbi:MAG: gliding motility-associated C-terminal domain-containing protein [Bacteroidetes bacterium]|nr:gliding motility-associated C-terminal domain-containing protein [Bacteroidota bacterium]HET6243849.1 gliding motility-associated C-terminal domain-containing protein [Bacteroidia bacterium]